jgi:energy-coupling factor transporter ATP-binding protein EcfA2
LLTTFKISDQKAIKRAECDSVPRIMIIKGQNGVGKSTLLYALKQRIIGNDVNSEDVIFISPLGGSLQKEYAGDDVYRNDPSYRITSVLGRLEIARRNIIAASSLLDNKNRSPADEYTSVSYIYEPLNKLLNMLLPHLKFERVDISDTDHPKCIFRHDTHSGISHPQNKVDIDELTRGEIGVISQFLPLLEHQILRKLVRRCDESLSDIVVLMDMPGLYLPPQLQSRLLEYIRSVVKEENESIQFIIVTSSTALTDKTNAEELFLLMPSQLLPEGSNQLVNVSYAKRHLRLIH